MTRTGAEHLDAGAAQGGEAFGRALMDIFAAARQLRDEAEADS